MSELLRGIVIKVVPYKESDAIVSLLTEEGVVSFKARGVFKINSKNAPLVQLYTVGEYKVESKTDYSNKTLSTGTIEYFPLSVYEDLQYSSLLSFIIEIINFQKENYYEAYKLLKFAIENLKNIDIMTYALITLKYLIKWNGVLFEVDSCVNCHRQSVEVFSYSAGGFLCKKCLNESSYNIINLLYLKQIRIIIKAKIENALDFSVDNVAGYKILIDLFKYIESNLGIYLRTKELLLILFNNTYNRLT